MGQARRGELGPSGAARGPRGRHSGAFAVLLAAAGLAALVGGGRAPLVARAAGPASTALAFGHEVVVDNQRITGEPSLSISPTVNSAGHHDIYISAPYGFLTTASFVWKSEDGGTSFHLVAAQVPPLGKPNTCAGGGDSSIVNDKVGNLYFADLQGLTEVSASVSADGGRSFTTTCDAASDTVGVDRPWLSVYGDPLTTGREYMTVDQVAQCTLNCGLGQASTSQVGSNQLQVTEASGTEAAAQVFSPAQPIEPDGIVGGTVVNQSTGELYIAHTGYTSASGTLLGGSDANGIDNAVVVDSFPTGYSGTPTPFPATGTPVSICAPYNPGGPCYSSTVYAAPLTAAGTSTVTTGQDFTPLAIDSAGNLYVVWAQAPVNASGVIDGASAIYLAVSTDNGKTWSPPYDVSASIPSLQTNVFPWVAAGGPGKVDVVWYGTPALTGCGTAAGCGSSTTQGAWNVYMAQSLNLVSSGRANPRATFGATKVTEYSNHYGAICTFGIGCSTGGDRGLLDFIQVQVGPTGAAYVTWADSANTNAQGGTSSAVIAFARQVSGPGLFGGDVSGPTPAYNCAAGSPSAYYSALGSETNVPANLDLVQAPGLASCIAQPNAQGDYVVSMHVSSLGSLTVGNGMGGPDAVWLTRWELPIPAASRTHTAQGHVFFAAMESDAGGTPTFYAGETGTVQAPGSTASQQGFMLTYPPTYSVPGSYDPATGIITIDVPAKDVGNPSAAPVELYSVTGLTATQAQPASTDSAIFNQIDATAPYDLLPSAPPPNIPEAPWLPALLLVAAAVLAIPAIRQSWLARGQRPAER